MTNIEFIASILPQDMDTNMRDEIISNLRIVVLAIGDDKIVDFLKDILLENIKAEPENDEWVNILYIINSNLNKAVN